MNLKKKLKKLKRKLQINYKKMMEKMTQQILNLHFWKMNYLEKFKLNFV